ncbi:site-specific DNA-methyltransferase [Escherichia coli]|nr:site-specific DNA-methyltransferase [Escherichia coli]
MDLIVCDPPYGTIKGLNIKGWGKETTVWDEPIAPEKLFSLCERVLRGRGALVLFAQEPYTSQLITRAHGNLPFFVPACVEKRAFR